MTSNLKVFVCEFITGGGLYNAPLPPSLAREGQAMLDAMLSDLLDIPGIEVLTTRDARLPPLASPVTTHIAHDDIEMLWQQCMDEAEAVWAVAPESGKALESMALMASSKWLGCHPEAIRIAASKRDTAMYLAKHNIPVVPTSRPRDWQPSNDRWVAKPDEGVGCDDMQIFEDANAMFRWLEDGRMDTHVIQPWLGGEAASISMLCRNGEARLLSCNRQRIETIDGCIRYRGSVLNGMAEHWAASEALAMQLAAALPALNGYVGVDIMVDDGRLTVMEINPRLTTSYAGLRHAIGVNPAELVLDLHYNGRFIEAGRLQRNVVEVSVVDD